jgi:hypothetical protein
MTRMSLKRLIGLQLAAVLGGFLLLIALFAIAFAALILAPGPSAADYEAALDELAIPADWELAHTTVEATGTLGGCMRLMNLNCPSVTRYYLVDGEATATYDALTESLTSAGFEIDQEFGPQCDLPPSGPLCSVLVSRRDVSVHANVNRPDSGDDGLGFREQDRLIVRLLARRSLTPASPEP